MSDVDEQVAALVMSGQVKALALRQPWAWLVVHGGKDIENRKWKITYRGPFVVHAAKGMTRAEYAAVVDYTRSHVDAELADRIPPPAELVYGALIGISRIVSCLVPLETPTRRWHLPGQYGAVLEGTRAIEALPCSGALGFFGLPAEHRVKILRTDPTLVTTAAAQTTLFGR